MRKSEPGTASQRQASHLAPSGRRNVECRPSLDLTSSSPSATGQTALGNPTEGIRAANGIKQSQGECLLSDLAAAASYSDVKASSFEADRLLRKLVTHDEHPSLLSCATVNQGRFAAGRYRQPSVRLEYRDAVGRIVPTSSANRDFQST